MLYMQLHSSEITLDQKWRCIIDLYVLLLHDADVLALPLQSDALSGALHPAPAKHCSEVLRSCTQDCPRNPIKQTAACQRATYHLFFTSFATEIVCT